MPFPIYDTEDAVPADQKDVYEEKDGKWHPKVPDVTNLSTALEKERTRASTEEAARKKAETELAAERRKKDAQEKGITDEQLQRLREEDANARKPIEEENATLKTKLEKLTIDDKVVAVALDAGMFKDDLPLMKLELLGEKRRFKLTDKEEIVVLDEKGEPTTKTVKAFFEEDYKKLRPKFYEASGASGSGAEGSGGGGGSNATTPPSGDMVNQKRDMVRGAL